MSMVRIVTSGLEFYSTPVKYTLHSKKMQTVSFKLFWSHHKRNYEMYLNV